MAMMVVAIAKGLFMFSAVVDSDPDGEGVFVMTVGGEPWVNNEKKKQTKATCTHKNEEKGRLKLKER